MLLLVVGTLVGVAIPMLMAIISIIVALGITAVVGQAFELNLFILNMIVAMGLALGIDYSLFIVSRLREERHRGSRHARGDPDGRQHRHARGRVQRHRVRAGDDRDAARARHHLRSLGLGAVIVGLVSIVVALTFHPAILMVLGDRVERLRVPWLGRRVAASAGEEGPLWRRAVLAVMRRPAISLIATTAVLLALAFPVLGLQLGAAGTSSLPDEHAWPSKGCSRWSATSPAARPSRSPSSSTARPTTRARSRDWCACAPSSPAIGTSPPVR